MKALIRRSSATLAVLCLLMLSGVALSPAPVYGLAGTVADLSPGATCGLPDGTQGIIQGDKHTCCPQNTQNGTSCLYAKYINPLIQLLSVAVGLAVVIAVVYGAIEYITSGGDPQRAAAGKKRITTALVSLAMFMLLYGFLQFIIPGGFFNGH